MHDDLVIGGGMAGLTVAALLATSGRKVLLLEAHDATGGYAHTFPVGDFRFCAQVHYLFGCGEGETIHRLLTKVGLADVVRFRRLDPEGFDHVVVDGERFRIPNGLAKQRDRLARRFPEHADGLRRYFALVHDVREELAQLPDDPSFTDLLTAPLHFPHLLRHRHATLGQIFEPFGFPPRLRAFLAGQCGDYLLPPSQASFLLHVALTTAYDRGAFYPEQHVHHLVEALTGVIRSAPGCEVLLGQEVDHLEVEGDRVARVHTTQGRTFTAGRVISNVDPARTATLVGRHLLPEGWLATLDYPYSASSFTMYLGVRGLDLAAHGFGAHNVWHYPHDDLDAIYRRQLEDHDLSDPWLFLATPTLNTDAPGLAPPGDHVLQVATSAAFAPWAALRAQGDAPYKAARTRVAETILDVLESRYLPGLREHLVVRVEGTPLTNAAFCGSPEGNAYGAALTPDHVRFPRVPFATPLENLWLVNATAGYPSVGGTVSSGLRLYQQLTGEVV